jgi:TPR repeat protein
MNFYRATVALLFSVLLFEATGFFQWYEMQAAVPRIRTLMPQAPQEIAAVKPPGRDAARAQTLCFSDAPVWQGGKTQMDYCMMAADAGDPAAQAMVAEFYLDGSTPASQAKAYAWLRTAATNSRDQAVADAARLRLGDLMRHLNGTTIDHAETLAARYMRKYHR